MHASGQQHLRARRAGRPDAADDHLDLVEALADQFQRVQQAGQHDNGRAVLVVVEDGDVELLLEALLDFEAPRRGNVLQVDAAKGRGDGLDDADDLFGVLGIEADGKGVDAGKLFKEHRLPFHHRHRRVGTDVAQAKHRRSVRDDATVLRLIVSEKALEGSSAMAWQTRATPGV